MKLSDWAAQTREMAPVRNNGFHVRHRRDFPSPVTFPRRHCPKLPATAKLIERAKAVPDGANIRPYRDHADPPVPNPR